MCGMFGVVSKEGVDAELLWNGTHRVRHRGPDDWGFVSLAPRKPGLTQAREWRFRGESPSPLEYAVGLGSRRLSILDLSPAARQPMHLRGTALWIVFNGEIYNHADLRRELAPDFSFESHSDTEVLLAAYAKWGPECLSRLNGMFAFAIWNASDERLFLARDRFGEKPLYYFWHKHLFVFGSELKQFFEIPGLCLQLNREALSEFLFFALQDHDERTFLRDVKQLPPAHSMIFDFRGGELHPPRRYWTPEIADDLDDARDENFPEKLRDLLEDSVRLRLRSDVPTGLSLSGGIDSGAICAIAAASRNGLPAGGCQDLSHIPAYTMTFPGEPEDELRSASRIASRTGVPHRIGTLSAGECWERLQEFVYFQDGPSGGVAILASGKIFKMARADGIKVLLNGQGSDELLGGYDKFFFFWQQILLRRGLWIRFMINMGHFLMRGGRQKWNRARARKYLPEALRRCAPGLWHFRTQNASFPLDLAPMGAGSSLNQRLWADVSRFSLPCLLHWEDRNSMAAGVEARMPFLDHRIAEAVFSTSVFTKLRTGFSKYALRCAMSDCLPEGICWQTKKRGFETPGKKWLAGVLAPQIKDLLHGGASFLSEYFHTSRLTREFDDFANGCGTLTEYDWFRIITSAIWLEQLHDSSSALSKQTTMQIAISA